MKHVIFIAVIFASCGLFRPSTICPEYYPETDTVFVWNIDTLYRVQIEGQKDGMDIPPEWFGWAKSGDKWVKDTDSTLITVTKMDTVFQVRTVWKSREIEIPIHIRDTVSISLPSQPGIPPDISWWLWLLLVAAGAAINAIANKVKNG